MIQYLINSVKVKSVKVKSVKVKSVKVKSVKMDRFHCTWCDGYSFGAFDTMKQTKCLSCGFKYQLKIEQEYKTITEKIMVKKFISCPKDSVIPFTTMRRFTTEYVPKTIEKKILMGKPKRYWIPVGHPVNVK